jgi:hypothetical protein
LHGCIPVLLWEREAPLPFHTLVPWSEIAIQYPLTRLPDLLQTLRAISITQIRDMQAQGAKALRYFKDKESIERTVIEIIHRRVVLNQSDVPYTRTYNSPIAPVKTGGSHMVLCKDDDPQFITMGVESARWKQSHIQEQLSLMYSALATAHNCLPLLFVYTNIAHRLVVPTTTWGQETNLIFSVYNKSRTVYDGSSYDGTDWMSISFNKIFLVRSHLEKGQKVIWVDLDTLVIHTNKTYTFYDSLFTLTGKHHRSSKTCDQRLLSPTSSSLARAFITELMKTLRNSALAKMSQYSFRHTTGFMGIFGWPTIRSLKKSYI